MTKTHHPSNKFQRKIIAEKKHRFVDEKKGTLKAERPAKVRRKLLLEQTKIEETEHELDTLGRDENGFVI